MRKTTRPISSLHAGGVCCGATLVLLLLPVSVWAQASGNISGTVTDATAGVLPGVTVEAASPALIEGARTAVTDGQGLFRIVDLRPGTYTVTFTLPGFSTVIREGIELNTGFTATVDVQMVVGSIEETITVSGESPVVDIQNVRTQNVFTREMLDSVPIAKTYSSLGAITLGATHSTAYLGHGDVGGSKGETVINLLVHNTGVGLTTIDGLRTSSAYRVGYAHRNIFNQMLVEEIVAETSGVMAENQSGGLNVNMVPKEGGNVFSGTFNSEYTGSGLQNSNFSDELRARGLAESTEIEKIYDVGVGFGGPLVQNKLWFFTAHRAWGSVEKIPGVFHNALGADARFYEPDMDRPGLFDKYVRDSALRLTWQASQNHKFGFSGSLQDYCWCDYGMTRGVAPEAVWVFRVRPNNNFMSTWTNTVSNRLLLEGGVGLRVDRQIAGIPEAQAPGARSYLELSSGITYGAGSRGIGDGTYGDMGNQGAIQARFAVSYITGSHAFKAGFQSLSGKSGRKWLRPPQAVQYAFNNRVPVELRQLAIPHSNAQKLKMDLGIFAQDQWTIDNLTLNLGVRFDHLNAYVPDQVRPGGEFAPAFQIDRIDNVPNWKDVNPRIGASYDLFGDGRTAIKASVGRYVLYDTTRLTDRVNPANAISHTTSRDWDDLNGDFVPDCDLTRRDGNGECGPMDNQNFGTLIVQNLFAPDILEGFGVRQANWQISTAIQHELSPGMALSVAYFRTWWENFTVRDNRAVTPADFDEFCVTAPTDSRLPGGGGNEICGLFDVNPEKFGQFDNLEVNYDNFGGRSQIYDGVEVSLATRYGDGGLINAGVSFGRTTDDQCNTPDLVVTLSGAQVPREHCKSSVPFRGQAQVKINGVYPMPWGIQSSFTLQNLPGRPIQASYIARGDEITNSLGRPLNRGFAFVELIEPNTEFEPRYTLLDLRFGKIVNVAGLRLHPRFDIYNVLNSAAIINQLTRYGGAWRRPTDIHQGRMYKFGFQLDF